MNCCSKSWTQNTYPQRSSVQCTSCQNVPYLTPKIHLIRDTVVVNWHHRKWHYNKICSTTAVESPQYLQDISQEHAQCGAVRCPEVRCPVAKYNMTRVWRNYVCMCIISTKLYLNISGICSTGEVGVDLLQMTLRVTASEKVKMKSCHSWLQLSHCIFSFDQLTICNYRYLCSIKLFEIDI